MTLPLAPPAFSWVPPYAETLGPEVADICELAGFPPDPEQQLALNAIFALKPTGKSAIFDTTVVGPRQNIKTGLFKQCALGWLFVTKQRLIIWSAHEFSTAQESHRDLAELVEGSDVLRKRIKTISRGNGDEGVELQTGQRVKFKARTKTGGRGLSGDKVVLDEAFALTPAHMGSLMPTLSVRPDPQLVYGSSAGLSTSDVLRALRDRGRAGGDPRSAYFEWCDDLPGTCQTPRCDHKVTTPGCRMDDVRRWLRANSQLGRRMTMEFVEDERRGLPPDEFGRERLGWWDEALSQIGVFPAGAWEATVDVASSIAGPVLLGVEVAQDRSWSCIGAAGLRADGLLHAQVAENYPGTDWVAGKLAELGASEVAIQPNSPAGSLVADIEGRGITVHKLSGIDYAAACGKFHDLVRDGAMRHLIQGELDTAVAGAEKRVTSEGAWVLDRKADIDISPLSAVVLAAHLASLERVSVYEERGVRFL